MKRTEIDARTQVKKTFKFPLYLVLYLVISLIGFVEAGPFGLLLALGSALCCQASGYLGLIPFVGIPLYYLVAGALNGLLGMLGISIPIAMAVSFIAFLILAVISNILVSFIALLVILKIILGD